MVSKCNPLEVVKAKIDEWLEWDKNETTKACIKRMAEENKMKELQNILLKRLDFGIIKYCTYLYWCFSKLWCILRHCWFEG